MPDNYLNTPQWGLYVRRQRNLARRDVIRRRQQIELRLFGTTSEQQHQRDLGDSLTRAARDAASRSAAFTAGVKRLSLSVPLLTAASSRTVEWDTPIYRELVERRHERSIERS